MYQIKALEHPNLKFFSMILNIHDRRRNIRVKTTSVAIIYEEFNHPEIHYSASSRLCGCVLIRYD